MASGNSLKSVTIENIPISDKFISALNFNDSIGSANNIKEFSLKKCSLTDAHLDKIKSALAKN